MTSILPSRKARLIRTKRTFDDIATDNQLSVNGKIPNLDEYIQKRVDAAIQSSKAPTPAPPVYNHESSISYPGLTTRRTPSQNIDSTDTLPARTTESSYASLPIHPTTTLNSAGMLDQPQELPDEPAISPAAPMELLEDSDEDEMDEDTVSLYQEDRRGSGSARGSTNRLWPLRKRHRETSSGNVGIGQRDFGGHAIV